MRKRERESEGGLEEWEGGGVSPSVEMEAAVQLCSTGRVSSNSILYPM